MTEAITTQAGRDHAAMTRLREIRDAACRQIRDLRRATIGDTPELAAARRDLAAAERLALAAVAALLGRESLTDAADDFQAAAEAAGDATAADLAGELLHILTGR